MTSKLSRPVANLIRYIHTLQHLMPSIATKLIGMQVRTWLQQENYKIVDELLGALRPKDLTYQSILDFLAITRKVTDHLPNRSSYRALAEAYLKLEQPHRYEEMLKGL